MNPRRMYYFLRVASFLFQNKTAELFGYVRKDTDFVPKLVRNLGSAHIMQLLLNMLKLEEQMKELAVPECEWTTVCLPFPALITELEHWVPQHYC